MNMNSKISFNYADRKLALQKKQHTKDVIEFLFKQQKQRLDSLSYVFCSDEYLLGINQSFLKHNYYTDIITFDLSESNNQGITGEVYISIDRVKENAVNQKTTFTNEILRVIFHGALHLCGYKDKTKEQKVIMRSLEDKYIKQWQKVSRNTVS